MPRSRAPNPDAVRFGELLNDLRLQRGWTLQQLARATNLTASYVGLVERGLNLPSVSIMINIAHVFDVDPGDLVRYVAAGRPRPVKVVLPPLPAPPAVDEPGPS